jgi:hypothetical protein
MTLPMPLARPTEPFVEVDIDKGSVTRPPTHEERVEADALQQQYMDDLRKIEELEQQIKELKKSRSVCSHKLCIDMGGWAYTMRVCYTCGSYIRSISICPTIMKPPV